MANYTIIGGDGKQYGPISEVELRRWIGEGRLDAHSLAKAESDAEFRPLATFPEISAVFGAPPTLPGVAPILASPGGDRDAAVNRVKVPAIGLMISASISVLESVWGLITFHNLAAERQELDSIMAPMGNSQLQQFMDTFMKFISGPFGIANYLFMILIAVLIFVGALKMLKLRSYEFSYAAAVLAVVPCITPCLGWLLGLIFGFWAMGALGKSKPYFA